MSDVSKKKAYFVGGGIASLAGAAFLIRDGKMPGNNIFILEEENVNGGALDGSGNPESGYISRGGRMFEKHFECTFNLFSSIPSINNPEKTSVTEDIFAFNKEVVSDAECRLLKMDLQKRDVSSYGLNFIHLFQIARLTLTKKDLTGIKINDWFCSSFFKTNFWLLWTTSFSFQPWDNADELRRYFFRFMHLLPGFNKFKHILRTRYNQYDALILPLQKHLEKEGVNFLMKSQVTDLTFDESGEKKRVSSICYNKDQVIEVAKDDLVFVTLGSMTENSTKGAMDMVPPSPAEEAGGTWALWRKLAQKSPFFGNPDVFVNNKDKTKWVSFTVTQTTGDLFKFMERFTHDKTGTGGLVSFVDSNWFMSIVMFHQPFFKDQPYGQKKDNNYVFWGYGLNPDAKGNFVKKKMSECTGEEILTECLSYLFFNEKEIDYFIKHSNCIPTMMPYITSQFNTREESDRPKVLPEYTENLAFLGQYVDIPEDVVFTVEYSVRSAMTAVYSMLGLAAPIPPVYQGQQHIDVLIRALFALLR